MYVVPRPLEKAGKTKSQIKNAKRRMKDKNKKHTNADDNDTRVSGKSDKPGVTKQEQPGTDRSKTATTCDKNGGGDQLGSQRRLKRKATQSPVTPAGDDNDNDNDISSKTDDHGITQNKPLIKDDSGVKDKPTKKRFADENKPSIRDEPSTEDENVEKESAFKDAPSTEDESGTDDEVAAEKEPAPESDASTRKVESGLMKGIFSDTSSDTSTSDHSELFKTAGNCKTGSVSSSAFDQSQNLRKFKQALRTALEQAARAVDRLDETQEQVGSAQNELESSLDDLAFARGELESTHDQLESTQEQLEQTQGQLESTKGQLERAQDQLESAQSQLSETVTQLEGAKEELVFSRDTMCKMEGWLKELCDRLVQLQMHV